MEEVLGLPGRRSRCLRVGWDRVLVRSCPFGMTAYGLGLGEVQCEALVPCECGEINLPRLIPINRLGGVGRAGEGSLVGKG